MSKVPQFRFPESEDRPLRKVARRLRWFLEAFSNQTREVSAEFGLEFEIDRAKLRSVFLSWVRNFEAQKPADARAKSNYITYSAATMLMELIKGQPLRIVRVPDEADVDRPAYFWPEGYAYLAFCMNVRSAVYVQELDLETGIAPEFDDIRTWWSFRENARENSATAIGFFELFVGDTPKWSTPELFSSSHAAENALRMAQRKQGHLAG